MSEQEISDNCNPNVNKGNGGTHSWLARYFFDDLKKQSFVFEGLAFNNTVGLLKRLRTDADYGHDDINSDQIDIAKKYSDKIQGILSKRYKK